jgi:hypothetical protein
MKDKVITLPQRSEMYKRLVAVMEETHVVEQFYPLLLKHAGTQKVAKGVVIAILLGIDDYTRDLPPYAQRILLKEVPAFVDAMVDDKGVAEDAKKYYRSVSNG